MAVVDLDALVETWNEFAFVFEAIKMDVTDTNSAAGSSLIWLGINGVVQFQVEKTGDVTIGSRLVIEDTGSSVATLTFGADRNTGFFEGADDALQSAHSGVARWEWFATALTGKVTGAGGLYNRAASSIIPSLAFAGDTDTGVGKNGADIGVLIAGGKNCLEFGKVSAAEGLGFYGAAAAVQPTGVAVNATAIHAALVTLGIIAGS